MQGGLVSTSDWIGLVTAVRGDAEDFCTLFGERPTGMQVLHGLARVPHVRSTPAQAARAADLYGRVVDALGRPSDGGAPVPIAARALFGRSPHVVPTAPWRRLTHGCLVFDLVDVARTGTSFLAVGAREVLATMIRHHAHAGRIVICAGDMPPHPDALVVRAAAGATIGARWLAPWTATTLAATLREAGHDVVVVVDDLAAWPADPRPGMSRSTQIATLAGRAYASGTGSVSLIARIAARDAALEDAFDATLDLDRAASGRLPALRSSLVRPVYRMPSLRVLGHAIFDREEPWVQAALRCRSDAAVDALVQQLALFAALHARRFDAGFAAALKQAEAPRLAAIRARGRIDAGDEAAVLALVTRRS